MTNRSVKIDRMDVSIPVTEVHTLIIGSGAAGLNAALQLHGRGIKDILIVSEGLEMGTSINTGSDKQTYYKSAMCGHDSDSPLAMAANYFDPGGMHGDLALVEAAVSGRAFLNLVNLGVDFPTDAFGQYVGYKTDHDPSRRGASVGPYTSRDMCRALIAEVKRRGIPVMEKMDVVSLLTSGNHREHQESGVCGALALDADGELHSFKADNVIFAVGGPGGLYRTSVYPAVHTGAIGIALKAGAAAQGLPESQFGLASVKFRWNVSGTYMQVVPRFVSVAADGSGQGREFLLDYFDDAGEMHSKVFLKGYQWPFDSKKIPDGSSIIDILVYVETVEKGRRVFLDFRSDPEGYLVEKLDAEAREYLEKSGARQGSPIERLSHMNPGAIELYRDHNIDISKEMLEVAVCAQHNNGGLAANHWWESVNLRGLYPVGEVNGSHGVARPGGSALNSGQVGGFRAAEFIAKAASGISADRADFERELKAEAADVLGFLDRCRKSTVSWKSVREEFQQRMTRQGSHIRSVSGLNLAVNEAREQMAFLEEQGCRVESPRAMVQALKNRQLCLAHRVYLEALLFQLESGVGSRGSALVQDPRGLAVHPALDKGSWSFVPENPDFRRKVLETVYQDGKISNRWVERRPIPESNLWFETAWADYRAGKIYGKISRGGFSS